ncbi:MULTISPECIES: hypothetical protein [Burkholderia]|nr:MULTISPECIES: hypothetical protein [Burkholderia]
MHTRRKRVGEPEWRDAHKVEPCGIKALPEFHFPMHGELVALYRHARDPDVRRVILEVVRARRVIGEIEDAGLSRGYRDRHIAQPSPYETLFNWRTSSPPVAFRSPRCRIKSYSITEAYRAFDPAIQHHIADGVGRASSLEGRQR